MAIDTTRSSSRRRARPKDKTLIDWIEPERNARVLDWRDRAQQFGPVPRGADATLPAVSTSPEQLLQEEEPEALADQPVLDGGDDEETAENDESEPPVDAPAASHEDADLVRMYLNQLGRR